MTLRHSAALVSLLGLAAFGWAGPAAADPVDPFVVPAPPAPVVTYPVAPVANGAAMTPHQLAVPGANPAAPPPASSVSEGGIPEIQNPVYGSGRNGGGILGTLKDLWQQVKDPAFVPDQIMGGAPAPDVPAQTGPTGSSGGSAPGPALPPGYYPIDGPPPPGYEYLTPSPSA